MHFINEEYLGNIIELTKVVNRKYQLAVENLNVIFN